MHGQTTLNHITSHEVTHSHFKFGMFYFFTLGCWLDWQQFAECYEASSYLIVVLATLAQK
jgi:hypothetical protein